MRLNIKYILFLVFVISGLSVLPASANTAHETNSHESSLQVTIGQHHGGELSEENHLTVQHDNKEAAEGRKRMSGS